MITLLTDFGTADYFVGATKGVILSVNPNATVIDITHDISTYDTEAAAFTLFAAYSNFPPNTIHVAIVDPGVGSDRRPILVTTEKYTFVGPDNGVFSYVCDREKTFNVYHLTNKEYFRHPVSRTFHGRDIFAPVAGALSNGIDPTTLGDLISDYKKLEPLEARVASDGSIEARIIHIDHFGNCITNLKRELFTDEMIAGGANLQMSRYVIKEFRQFLADMNGKEEELFGVWGSAGFLEIAAFRASAALVLGVERGERVFVTRQ